MDNENSNHLKYPTPPLLKNVQKEGRISLPNILKAIHPNPNKNNLSKLKIPKIRPVLEGYSSSRASLYRIPMPSVDTKRSTSQIIEDSTPTKKNFISVTKVSHLHHHKSTIINNTSEMIGSPIRTSAAGEIQSQIGNIASILKTARASSMPYKKEILSFEDKKRSVERGSRIATKYIVNTKLIEAEIRETLISYDVVIDKNGKKPRPGIYTGRRRSLIKLNDESVLKKTGGNIVDNDYTTLSKRLMTKYVHEVAKQFVSYHAPEIEAPQDSSSARKKPRRRKHASSSQRQKNEEEEKSVGVVFVKEPPSATPVNLSEEPRKMKMSKSQPKQVSFFAERQSGDPTAELYLDSRKNKTPPTGSLHEINEKDWKFKKIKRETSNKDHKEEPLYNIDIWDHGEKKKETQEKPQEPPPARKILLSYSDKTEGRQRFRGRQIFGNTLLKRVNTPQEGSLSERKNTVATISEETFEQSGFHKGLSPLIQDLIL